MSESTSRSSGIGITGILGIVFVTLKLTGYIDWSWWWVTAPFWGGLAIFLSLISIGIIFVVVKSIFKSQ